MSFTTAGLRVVRVMFTVSPKEQQPGAVVSG